MANKLLLIFSLFSAVIMFSCKSVDHRNVTPGVVSCSLFELKSSYFLNWSGSIDCARKILQNSNDSQSVQTSHYVLGEYYYITGDPQKALAQFLNSVEGPDGNTALSSLSYIRNLNIPFNKLGNLYDISTSRISDDFAKYVIENEKKDWALIKNDMERFDEISSAMNILNKAVIVKNSHGLDILKLDIDKGLAADISYPSDSLNIFNYLSVDEGEYFVIYDFSVGNDSVLPIFFQTDSKTEIYLNGTLVSVQNEAGKNTYSIIRNGGKFKLTKGDHRIVAKISALNSESARLKIFLPDRKVRTNYRKTGTKGTALRYDTEKKNHSDFFETMISMNSAVISGNRFSTDDFIELFSKIIGTDNPVVWYSGADIFYRNNDIEKGDSLLKKTITSYPGTVEPVIKLMGMFSKSSRSEELAKMRKTILSEYENNIDFRLLVSDLFSADGQTVSDLKYCEETFKKFNDFFAVHIYYAFALEEYGDVQGSMKIRLNLLEKVPNYYPLLESILSSAEKTKDLKIQKKMITKMLKLDPDSLKLKIELAKVFLLLRDVKRSEKLFLKILKNNPDDTDALSGMGDIEIFRNNKRMAAEYYKKASILNPEDDLTYKKSAFFEEDDSSGFFQKFELSDNDLQSIYKMQVLSSTNPYEIFYDEGINKVINQKNIKSRFRMIIKINNASGVQKLRSFPVNGDVIFAKIIKSDGKISKDINVDKNGIYFRSLEAGDVIDLKYGTDEKSEYWLQGFNSSWLFGEEGVISRKSIVVFYLPEKIHGNFSTRGNVKKSSISFNNGTVDVFQSENVFVPPFENFMPFDRQLFIPGVEYSFIPSWDDFAKWQIKFINESSVISNEIAAISEKIGDSTLFKLPVIEILRDFVARKIGYSFDDSGIDTVKPDESDIVLKKMSGDYKDKALLLKVMLNSAGIKAQYSLVKSKDYGNLNKELPYMQFNHALVYIPIQDGIEEGFFVDPSADYDNYLGISALYEDAEAMIFDETTNGYNFTKIKGNSPDSVEVVINPDGISSAEYKGTQASSLRYKINNGEQIQKAVTDSLFFISSPEEIKTGQSILNDPLVIEFKSSDTIPMPVKALFNKLIEQEKRDYPVDLSMLPDSLSISVVSGIKSNLRNFELNDSFFSYSSEKFGSNGIRVLLKVKKKIIGPEEFAELKKTIISIIEFEDKLSVE
ncbi:MAG TPA: hypothetical protein PKG52_04005 [bacterium]|nr:hypothetical protein [bacterium]